MWSDCHSQCLSETRLHTIRQLSKKETELHFDKVYWKPYDYKWGNIHSSMELVEVHLCLSNNFWKVLKCCTHELSKELWTEVSSALITWKATHFNCWKCNELSFLLVLQMHLATTLKIITSWLDFLLHFWPYITGFWAYSVFRPV